MKKQRPREAEFWAKEKGRGRKERHKKRRRQKKRANTPTKCRSLIQQWNNHFCCCVCSRYVHFSRDFFHWHFVALNYKIRWFMVFLLGFTQFPLCVYYSPRVFGIVFELNSLCSSSSFPLHGLLCIVLCVWWFTHSVFVYSLRIELSHIRVHPTSFKLLPLDICSGNWKCTWNTKLSEIRMCVFFFCWASLQWNWRSEYFINWHRQIHTIGVLVLTLFFLSTASSTRWNVNQNHKEQPKIQSKANEWQDTTKKTWNTQRETRMIQCDYGVKIYHSRN